MMYQWIIHRSWIKPGKYICAISHCAQRVRTLGTPSAHWIWTCDCVSAVCIALHAGGSGWSFGVWYTARLTANLRCHGCWMGKVSRARACILCAPKLRSFNLCIGFGFASINISMCQVLDHAPCCMFLLIVVQNALRVLCVYRQHPFKQMNIFHVPFRLGILSPAR